MQPQVALEIADVSKRFGKAQALDKICLKVDAGELHVLLGSSGSGKSTLIRIIMGLLAQDEGTLRIGGEDRASVGAQAWSHKIGYVPQEGGLFPHLNGFQNVSLVASLQGWPKRKLQSRAIELAQLMSLEPALLKRYPRELSGGQRQRLALVRAAFLHAPLLILDEPLGALDPLIRRDVQDDLKKVFRQLGTSVLIVTHDIEEAHFFGDRLSLLREGKILQTGSFQDLVERPADPFVTRFVESARRWDA